MTKKAEVKLGLYLVTPEQKPGIVWPSIPKDALPGESQYCYYARKYMETHAAKTNARVQSEIDDVTRQMIDVEQQLLAAQNVKDDVRSLMDELARLQSKRKAKKASLVFQTMKKGPSYGDPSEKRVLRFYLFRQLFLALAPLDESRVGALAFAYVCSGTCTFPSSKALR